MADFLGGLMARRVALLAVMTISQSGGLAVIALTVVFVAGPAPSVGFVPFAMLAGLAGVCGLAAFYRALAVGTMSIVAPISSMAVLIPVTFGLATGDRPSAVQSVGAAVGIAGIVLVSRELSEEAGRDRRLSTGVGLALLSAIGFGSFFVAMDAAAAYDPLWANLVNRGTSLSLGLLAVLAFRPSYAGVGGRVLPILLAVGVVEMTANVAYAFAVTKGLLSLTAILASLYPVVVIMLAWLVLGERLRPVQKAGAAAAICGVVLIAGG